MIVRDGNLFGASDILSDCDPELGVPKIEIRRETGRVVIQANFSGKAELCYTVYPDRLNVRGTLLKYRANCRYAFLISAVKTTRWQIFGMDGVRDDFIDPALIDGSQLGCINRMSREHLHSPVLYRTYSMPLDPNFPVIRLFDREKRGMEIVQDNEFSPDSDEIAAFNRMDGKSGFHVAFFWNQPGPLSTADGKPRSFEFTIRPASARMPAPSAAKIGGIDFRPRGIDWIFSNGIYTAEFSKNGGSLKALRFGRDPKAVIEKQDILSTCGFAPELQAPVRASYDMETQCRIIREAMLPFLDGLECWHSRLSPETTSAYIALAREEGLMVTGGSDCHQDPIIMGTVDVPAYVAGQFGISEAENRP